jgi:hypothetical protein
MTGLTEQLVADYKRLCDRVADVEAENAALKTQLAGDRAIAHLLQKIGELERDKARLISTVQEQAQMTNRFVEIESELESFANLYVASFQLHSSLRVRTVVRHIRELLVQLVGVRSLGIYVIDDSARHLVPIAADGVDVSALRMIPIRDGGVCDGVEALVERTFSTGMLHVAEGETIGRPAACIPLALEDRAIGAIVVYALLEHKKRFVTVDRELFKLLGAHAAGALVSAHLWGQADGHVPSAEALREMCA